VVCDNSTYNQKGHSVKVFERSLKDRSHANKYLRKIKVNIGNKIGICISAYSNADVICYSATWQTKLNDVRLNVDRS